MNASSRVTLSAGDVCRQAGARVRSLLSKPSLLVCAALLGMVPAAFADLPPSSTAPVSAIVPFRCVHGFVVIVPVSINGSGPYDFMLDTGATITAVDRELGTELALQVSGQGTATTLVEHVPVSLAVAHQVSVGPVTEQSVVVMVRDLKGLRALAPTIRGVLGQNALNHADYLLDYRHKLLHFDMDGALARSLGGHHIPLRRSAVKDNPQYGNLAVHAAVPADGVTESDFLLDSGTGTLVLFGSSLQMDLTYTRNHVADVAGQRQPAELRNLQLSLDGKSRMVPTFMVPFRDNAPGIGGLLPTSIFQSVYVSNSSSFAMFEPKMRKPGHNDQMIASATSQAGAHGGGS